MKLRTTRILTLVLFGIALLLSSGSVYADEQQNDTPTHAANAHKQEKESTATTSARIHLPASASVRRTATSSPAVPRTATSTTATTSPPAVPNTAIPAAPVAPAPAAHTVATVPETPPAVTAATDVGTAGFMQTFFPGVVYHSSHFAPRTLYALLTTAFLLALLGSMLLTQAYQSAAATRTRRNSVRTATDPMPATR